MKTKSWLIVAVVLAGLGAAAWFGVDTCRTAQIGTAYLAKQTCSCVYVAHRSEESCRTDYAADAIKPLTLEPGPSSIGASALGGLVHARAQFEKGFGCHLID
jgi:hypothetical protein